MARVGVEIECDILLSTPNRQIDELLIQEIDEDCSELRVCWLEVAEITSGGLAIDAEPASDSPLRPNLLIVCMWMLQLRAEMPQEPKKRLTK